MRHAKDSMVALERLRMDLMERSLRHIPLRVRTFSSDFADQSDADLAPMPGTVIVFFAHDADVLKRLSKALDGQDSKALMALRVEVDEKSSIVPTKGTDMVQILAQSECVFDVRYNGRTILDNCALPDSDLLGSAAVSWTGGELGDGMFSIVEYHKRESDVSTLHYLAYKRAPFLTDLERSMIAQIPPEISEIHLGVRSPDETRTAREVCRIVEKAAKDAARTRTCARQLETLERLEESIRNGQISPEATVRELVKARLELMVRTLRK
ncbi:hypothetical protein [Streptomyces formicae]|uniref:Uncharacterized protein n=1 Tax=Streptomyces formicae TaxID=1616117 RepID=A0ABY3WXW3_9ACTN|nr:hypothetical protein [Streptomyces formicae]UNM15627.1 hypothetical protein J4032_32935 [Streptomyces formicae]